MKRSIAICSLLLLFLSSCGVASAPSNATAIAATLPSSTAPFKVTSVTVSVTPTTLTTWKCGAYIQAMYTATFHVNSEPNGGVMNFSWTTNNGRGQTNEKLTIIAGQTKSDYVFTWQGPLPADHTEPEEGIVMVTYPNTLLSHAAYPTGKCREGVR